MSAKEDSTTLPLIYSVAISVEGGVVGGKWLRNVDGQMKSAGAQKADAQGFVGGGGAKIGKSLKKKRLIWLHGSVMLLVPVVFVTNVFPKDLA